MTIPARPQPLYAGPWSGWQRAHRPADVYKRTRSELHANRDATGCGYTLTYHTRDGRRPHDDGAVHHAECDHRCHIMQADDYGPARVLPVCADHLSDWVMLVGVGGALRHPVRTASSLNKTISAAVLTPRYTPAMLMPSQVISHGPRDEVRYLEVRYKLAGERSCTVPLDVHEAAKVAADEVESVSILDGVDLLLRPGLHERLRVLPGSTPTAPCGPGAP